MQLNPQYLPDIATLRRRSQALAMLDAIVCPDWEYRYYSFNASWGDAESMGSMRNGSGDAWFILFGVFGAAIKGLAHEASIAGDEVLAGQVQRQVPQSFTPFFKEAAFSMDELSYCYWRSSQDASWQRVVHPDPVYALLDDGSAAHLALLVEPATLYKDFAMWYYECDVPLASVESIYHHRPLTESLVASLSPGVSLDQALEAAADIGYPAV